MRPPFSDESELKRQAKRNQEDGLARLRRWWQAKYRLPASHPLFQGQTVAELLLEHYEDLWEELAGLEAAEARMDDPGRLPQLRERARAIRRALGTEAAAAEDPLTAYWEAEVAAGRVPDMDMTLADLKAKGR